MILEDGQRRAGIGITVFCFLIAAFCLLSSAPAYAGLIRDAEIEHTLQAMTTPIFRAAGFEESRIRVFIIGDDSINAFVAGGENIFVHTGLIMASRTPEMLQSVIAHESGHIAGGHLARRGEAMRNAQIGAIIGYLLGGAAVAAGSPQAGIAAMSVGSQAAMGTAFKFTRGNEESADEAGLRYMDAAGISTQGFLDMLETLRGIENLNSGVQQNPYLRTHPLTTDRIATVRAHVNAEKTPARPSPFTAAYGRMQAKLTGFLAEPSAVLQRYPVRDTSDPARYARAIAWFRQADLPRSLAELDALLAKHPKDAFFYDTKGQILFESARVAEAQAAYSKAHTLAPDNALIAASLGQTLVAQENPALYGQGIDMLNLAVARDKTITEAWYWLGVAYGRTGDTGHSHLALAEEALLKNRLDDVLRHSAQAQAALPANSAGWLQAKDLQLAAREQKQQRKDEK